MVKRENGVFISYTKKDVEFARKLARDLRLLGLSVWFDEWEMKVGDSIVGRIENGIEESQWMIVILSPDAVKSQWVLKELRSGLTKEIGDVKKIDKKLSEEERFLKKILKRFKKL